MENGQVKKGAGHTHLNETSSSISPLPRCDLLLVLLLVDDGVDLILLALGGLVDTPFPLLFSEQEDWCLRRLELKGLVRTQESEIDICVPIPFSGIFFLNLYKT